MKKKHMYLKTDRDREQSPAMSDDLTGECLKYVFLNKTFWNYHFTIVFSLLCCLFRRLFEWKW